MPTDDFLRGWRRTGYKSSSQGFPTNDEASTERPLLRLYVDGCDFMREIKDLTSLRRGDHCVIAVKTVRAISPSFDRFTSWLSRYGFCCVYHHFVLLDNVASLDAAGVPRTKDGGLVGVLEYTNTAREATQMVRVMSKFSLAYTVPTALRFLAFHKGQCHVMPLTDYGDMPCFFKLLRNWDEGKREEIALNAEQITKTKQPYNAVMNNCEHCINQVCLGSPTSPQVPMVMRNVFRVLTRIAALKVVASSSCLSSSRINRLDFLAGSIGLATVLVPALTRLRTSTSFLRKTSGCQDSCQCFDPMLCPSSLVDKREVDQIRILEYVRCAVGLVGGSASFLYAFWLARNAQIAGNLGAKDRTGLPGLAVALCIGGYSIVDSLTTAAAVLLLEK